MLRTRRDVPPPEHGSTHGIHLRRGRYRDATALTPPAWTRNGALYSIYPRAFSPEGTLAAIVPALERIAAAGAAAIWLLPIHPVGAEARKGSRGSPYAVRDYRAVDPALGTFDDLRRLVDAAHAKGLKVIIDFVANHAAPDHVLAKEHPEWFARDAEGRPTRRVEDWTDVADWRFDADGVIEYLAGSAAFWVREAGLDGFRCDVAGMVPRALWREVHERLAALRADHFMLAEWQDAELHAIAFHASYDWALYRALRDAVRGRVKATAVTQALTTWRENFPAAALPLRFVENHDEPRAMAVFGPRHLNAAAAVAFLSGGLPLLYNGQEVGATHRPSLFDAEPIRWDGGRPQTIYAQLLELRRRNPLWGVETAEPIETDAPDTVVAFARAHGRQRGIVLANLGPAPVTVRVTARAHAGAYKLVLGAPAARRAGGQAPAGQDATFDPTTPQTLAPGQYLVGEA